jgi:hypothetical protein
MSHKVYLDETGDLGWKLNLPNGRGGSSRFITISFVIVPDGKEHLTKRIVKNVYNKFGLDPSSEIKGCNLYPAIQNEFANQVIGLLTRNPDIILKSVTTKKQNVNPNIRKDGNILYNYMIERSLLYHISKFDSIKLVRDNKTVKVKSQNSLADYLKVSLAFRRNSSAELIDIPSESHTCKNLIFIDWFSYIAWSYFETNKNHPFLELSPHVLTQRMFF